MQGKMTVLTADGGEEVHHYDAPIKLEDMQAKVGGSIELIPGFEVYNGLYCAAFCDEEGKIKGKRTNRAASIAWYTALGRNVADVLVGDVIIITGDQQFMGAL